MKNSIIVLFFLIYCFYEAQCDTANETLPSNDASSSWNEVLPWKPSDSRDQLELPQREVSSVKFDGRGRKQRFLNPFAGFLAGLSIGGLASAATANVKAITKLPQASLVVNWGPQKPVPILAGYYDSYGLLHPVIYTNPIGLLVDQKPHFTSPGQVQNHFQTATESQPLPSEHLPDSAPSVIHDYNKRPVEVDSDVDEYIEESKKMENDSDANEETEDQNELRTDNESNEKSTTTIRTIPCSKLKQQTRKPNRRPESKDLQTDADDSQQNPKVNVADTANTTNLANLNQTTPTPPTVNSTGYPPYYGYYGGSPQPIDHLQLTTGADMGYKLDYNQYLPYDRPSNFNPNEFSFSNSYSNSYPSAPFVNSYGSNQYSNSYSPVQYYNSFPSDRFPSNFPSNTISLDQPPEFTNTEFGRAVSNQDNTFQPVNNYPNNFRPIIYKPSNQKK